MINIPIFVEFKVYNNVNSTTVEKTRMVTIPINNVSYIGESSVKNNDGQNLDCAFISMKKDKTFFRTVDSYSDVKKAIDDAISKSMYAMEGISEVE